MNMRNLPKSITADKTAEILEVQWSDGHLSRIPFELLRAGCPCADCRGGHEHMRPEPDPGVFDRRLPPSPATRLRRIEAMGSYALTIEWEDGHHFGIYSWNYLRLLCPCNECRKA